MGLDFSHGNARWSYSGFGAFRSKLAREIQMDLDEMDGFGGEILFSEFKDDIIPLLDHSDCDGYLTVKECKTVSKRLKEIISHWDDSDCDKQRGLELIEGMLIAVSNNEKFEFE